MKAKLISEFKYRGVVILKDTEVRIIKGMEADSEDIYNVPCGMCYLCEHDGVMNYIPARNLMITDWDNIDWEQRRYEIAKEAMTAIMCNSNFYKQVLYDNAKKVIDKFIKA